MLETTEAALRTGTVTFLLTDVEGSTKLGDADPGTMAGSIAVVAAVESRKETRHAAVFDQRDALLGDHEFIATIPCHQELTVWLEGFGARRGGGGELYRLNEAGLSCRKKSSHPHRSECRSRALDRREGPLVRFTASRYGARHEPCGVSYAPPIALPPPAPVAVGALFATSVAPGAKLGAISGRRYCLTTDGRTTRHTTPCPMRNASPTPAMPK